MGNIRQYHVYNTVRILYVRNGVHRSNTNFFCHVCEKCMVQGGAIKTQSTFSKIFTKDTP